MQLTPVQTVFLKKVCVLLFVQMLLLVAIVFGFNRLFPDRERIFVKSIGWDVGIILILSLVIMSVIFLANDYGSPTQYLVRCAAFFALGILLSCVLAVQFNVYKKYSTNPEKTGHNFLIALGITVFLFSVLLALLPRLLNYAGSIAKWSVALGIGLIFLLICGFFYATETNYLVLALFLFLAYLVFDLTLITYKCKVPNTFECDAPTGATNLYLDLVNIVQKLFMLLEKENR